MLEDPESVGRRASCEKFVRHFSSFRVKRLEEIRFHIGHAARREKWIEHTLQLYIRHGLENVGGGLAETPQGFKDFFCFFEISVIGAGNRENAAEIRKRERNALDNEFVGD